MLSEELFEPANPFGKATDTVIAEFEREIGVELPSEYRSYLLKFNGSEPCRTHFSMNSNAKNGYRLHHMYGLHDGPKYLRLQENWAARGYYDLRNYGHVLDRYCTIALCASGELLLLDIRAGTVHLLDPELGTFRAGFESQVKNGSSFDTFITNLNDLSERLAEVYSPDEQDAFKRRLAELRLNAQKDE